MQVALYCRVSTDEQAQRFGLQSQLHELRALAAARGYVVPPGGEYLDDGYSGAELERPALRRLREAVRAGTYQAVLVHDPDRLARRLVHQLVLTEEFERVGIRVEFQTTPRESTPEGQLLLSVKGVIAEYEREKIVERTIRGKREKARRGLVVASYPYGYRPDPASPGRLVVYEPDASVVRMIYARLIDDRQSVRAIVDELRRLQVPAARAGRQWGATQVRRILTSDRYTGRTYFNRGQVTSGGRRTERPAAEWIPVPIPALITPERFAAAQAQLARNRATLVGRPALRLYLLRGLLRCGICANRYESVPAHDRRYYRCHGRDRFTAGPRCRSPWLSADGAETAVWQAISEALRRPGVLRAAVERHEAAQGARDVELQSQAEHLRHQLHGVQSKERRLLDLYLDDDLKTPEIRGRLQVLARERAALTAALERATAAAAAHAALEQRLDAIERWCAQARRGLTRLDRTGRRDLLLELVDEIRVGRDRTLEIHGILPSPAASSELVQRC